MPIETRKPSLPNPSRRRLPGGLQGPLYPGGIHGMFLEQRRKEAAERQEARNKLSPSEQIALLDQRLGKGLGAKKERARLRKLMDAKPKETSPKEEKPAKKK